MYTITRRLHLRIQSLGVSMPDISNRDWIIYIYCWIWLFCWPFSPMTRVWRIRLPSATRTMSKIESHSIVNKMKKVTNLLDMFTSCYSGALQITIRFLVVIIASSLAWGQFSSSFFKRSTLCTVPGCSQYVSMYILKVASIRTLTYGHLYELLVAVWWQWQE